MNEQKDVQKKDTCFIITPIGSEDSPIRRHIDGVLNEAIIPALENRFDVKVSHRISKIGSINKQILQLIYECDLVIANLTSLNPNVMYELAFRHSTGKPVITIAENGTMIPFDVIDARTIFYAYDPYGMGELRKDLVSFLDENDLTLSDYGPIIETFKSIGYEKKIKNILSQNDDEGLPDLFSKLMDRIDDLDQRRNSSLSKSLISQNQDFIRKLDHDLFTLQSKAGTLMGNPNEDFYKTVYAEMQANKLILNEIDLPENIKKQFTSRLYDCINMISQARVKLDSTH